ncbi:hypothetical protein LTR86_007986 [Recurvomyces mirabilis]|nr:hypothetical protein LTR86_007986 [Recurvomyces mirabilis]
MDTPSGAAHVLLTTVRWLTERPLIHLLRARPSISSPDQWPIIYQYIPTKTTHIDRVFGILATNTPTTAFSAESGSTPPWLHIIFPLLLFFLLGLGITLRRSYECQLIEQVVHHHRMAAKSQAKIQQLEQQCHELLIEKTDLEWSYQYIQSDLSDSQGRNDYWLESGALTDISTLDLQILELQKKIQQLTSYTAEVDNQANAVTRLYATQLVALRFQIQQLTCRNSKLELANNSWSTFTERKQSKEQFDDLTSRLRERSRQVRELQERTAALEHCIMDWPTTITDDTSQFRMDELQTHLENQQKVIESLKQQVSTRSRGGKRYNEGRDRCNVHSENLKKNYGLHYPVMLEEIELAHRHLNFIPGTVSHSDFDRPANKAACYTIEDYEPYDTDGLFAAQSLKPIVRVPNSTSVQRLADAAPPTHAIVYPATRWTAFGQKRKDDQAKQRGEARRSEAATDAEALPALHDPAEVTIQQPDEDRVKPLGSMHEDGALLGSDSPTRTAVRFAESLATSTEDPAFPILKPQTSNFTPEHRMPVLVPEKAAGLGASVWAAPDDGPVAGPGPASATKQQHDGSKGKGSTGSGTL